MNRWIIINIYEFKELQRTWLHFKWNSIGRGMWPLFSFSSYSSTLLSPTSTKTDIDDACYCFDVSATPKLALRLTISISRRQLEAPSNRILTFSGIPVLLVESPRNVRHNRTTDQCPEERSCDVTPTVAGSWIIIGHYPWLLIITPHLLMRHSLGWLSRLIRFHLYWTSDDSIGVHYSLLTQFFARAPLFSTGSFLNHWAVSVSQSVTFSSSSASATFHSWSVNNGTGCDHNHTRPFREEILSHDSSTTSTIAYLPLDSLPVLFVIILLSNW